MPEILLKGVPKYKGYCDIVMSDRLGPAPKACFQDIFPEDLTRISSPMTTAFVYAQEYMHRKIHFNYLSFLGDTDNDLLF